MLINTDTRKPNSPKFSRVKRITFPDDFSLDWRAEHNRFDREVWRLRTSTFSGTLAYISLSYDSKDEFAIVNLIERRQWNNSKPYEKIGETLMAFACMQSFSAGYGGIVTFMAKSNLISYYRERMYAKRIGNSHKMVIFKAEAKQMVEAYL